MMLVFGGETLLAKLYKLGRTAKDMDFGWWLFGEVDDVVKFLARKEEDKLKTLLYFTQFQSFSLY